GGYQRRGALRACDGLGRVAGRFRVGENERVHVTCRVTEDGERDITAHRQAGDHRLVDVQRVEEIDHVAGIVVYRRSRRVRGAAAAPAPLPEEEAPAGALEPALPRPPSR